MNQQTLTKRTSGLKRHLQLWADNNTDNVSKSQQVKSELTLLLLLWATHQPHYKVKQSHLISSWTQGEENHRKDQDYQEGNLKYGFTFTITNEQCPQCMLYLEIQATERMKPSRRKSKHPGHRQTTTIFSKMSQVMCYSIQYFAELHNKVLEIISEACYVKMQDKKPYATRPLFLPIVVKMNETTHGKQYGDKGKGIALSANTVGKCTENTARDLQKQAVEKFCSVGSLLYGKRKSTDVFHMSQLMILARFCFRNELLFVRHQRKDVPVEKRSQQITFLTKTKRFIGGDIFKSRQLL